MKGTVIAVCTSQQKGQQKTAQENVFLIPNHGVQGDAHAGDWHRQVSLLEDEQIQLIRKAGVPVVPGAFGENIVIKNFNLQELSLGQCFRIGAQAVLQVSQHGKECHSHCSIFFQAGKCIMPTHGVFARVLKGGEVTPGNTITLA